MFFGGAAVLKAIEIGQEEGERSQSLLPVNDIVVAILVRDDYRAEEVLPIVGNGLALLIGLIVEQEPASQVLNEFPDLLALPLVVALVCSRSGTFAPAGTSPICLRLEFCSLGVFS